MTQNKSTVTKFPTSVSMLLLLALVMSGLLGLFYFWTRLLRPGDLSVLSLPLVAVVAGVAAIFSPCSLPMLPALLTSMGGKAGNTPVRRKLSMSLAASMGAISVVSLVGVLVAIVGTGTKGIVGPYVRWLQLGAGIFMVSMALVHLFDASHRMPGVKKLASLGSAVWDTAMRNQSRGGSYIFGAGYVLVGVD